MQLELTDEAITKGRQDLHMVRLCDSALPGEAAARKFRTTIKRDLYDFQSFARVELWTPAGWTEVVSLRGEHPVMAELPAHAVPESQLGDAYDDMRSVARMLETQAEEVTRS